MVGYSRGLCVVGGGVVGRRYARVDLKQGGGRGGPPLPPFVGPQLLLSPPTISWRCLGYN